MNAGASLLDRIASLSSCPLLGFFSLSDEGFLIRAMRFFLLANPSADFEFTA